jgi:glycosyltransferase involved in cell wall biosynthesis
MSDTLNVFSPNWDRADSYGRLGREMVSGLRHQRVHVNAIGGGSPKTNVFKTVVGGMLLGWPSAYHNYGPLAQVGPRVALTMFESNDLPFGWSDVLNTMQAVVVPSQWLVEVFRDNGVEVPIHVVPLGISRAFKYQARTTGRPYTFIAFADKRLRKGWHIAASAFARAFGESDKYQLILKCRKGSDDVPGVANANMHVIRQDLSDKRMNELYGMADCMVFPTCGEGFGLPPREFAATGGTSIVTNWGGTADDLSAWGLPINYSMQCAWTGHETLAGIGEWAAPDVDDLAATMTQVAAHASFYAERGRVASAFVSKNYRWGAFAKALVPIWQQACRDYAARPKTEVIYGRYSDTNRAISA